MKRLLCCVVGLIVIVALFTNSEAVVIGIMDGCRLCMHVLLPSLFPFMIITSFLSLSGVLSLPSKLLIPIFKLLHLPNEMRDIWLASFLGGYPTGAHTLSTLVQQGLLPRHTANWMLRCCINPGPAFLVLAVGQGMLGSQRIGILLLISQAISSLILCTLLCHNKKSNSFTETPKKLGSFTHAFVTSVSGSASAMITIFSYVLTFSVILSLIGSFDDRLKPFSAILEVTLGCTTAAQLGGKIGLLLIAFLIGFGGLSVCFQVLALASKAEISINGFWRARFLAGILNAGIFRILLNLDKTAVTTIAVNSPPMAIWSVDRVLGAACITAMLLISMKKMEPVSI